MNKLNKKTQTVYFHILAGTGYFTDRICGVPGD